MTAQIPDKFEWNGQHLPVQEGARPPTDDPRIESVGAAMSTACYRGYIATWAVRDERLVLLDLAGNYRIADGKPLAIPFTGRFLLGIGEAEPYAFAPLYGQHIALTFTDGLLTQVA